MDGILNEGFQGEIGVSGGGEDDYDSVRSATTTIPLEDIIVAPVPQPGAKPASDFVTESVPQLRNDAVTVRNAYKSYGKGNRVLRNFNMTVKEGTIYSLLGSSGCGKTTILSAIVGLRTLESGQIRVFGEIPGTRQSGIPGRCVGHMPQDYALHPDFSVEESFHYYGLIYGMSTKKIKQRSEFLVHFLDLPCPSRRISDLSGGQKRRVSLGVAMIHEPRLLILDEPTVGVDHLLRENIWNLLRALVQNGDTTVIITTHYIEESRSSATIGLMRNGHLLVERNPKELFLEYNTTLLEDVVLHLSRNDADIEIEAENEADNKDMNIAKDQPDNSVQLELTLTQKSRESSNKSLKNRRKILTPRVSFPRFRALVTSSMLLLMRNFIFLLFNFFSPSLQVVLSCLAIGNNPQYLAFGVINQENLDGRGCESLRRETTTKKWCSPVNWGCRYLDFLEAYKNTTELVYYTDESEALQAVQDGKVWGYVSIPQNYSHELRNRIFGGVTGMSNKTIDESSLTFHMDLSSQAVAFTLQRAFVESFQNLTSFILKQCKLDPRSGELPLRFENPVYGNKDTNFREWVTPNILLAILFFLPMCSGGITYISDRKAGILDRSLVAGATHLEVLVANLITQTLGLVVQSICAFFVMTVAFGIVVQGSTVLLVCQTILVGVAGLSMGFLVATIVDDEIQAVLLSIGMFFPNLLLSGMLWPSEGMPKYLQYISYLCPCTVAAESIRSIISRGWGLSHFKVWIGFASVSSWIAFFWLLTIIMYRISSRHR